MGRDEGDVKTKHLNLSALDINPTNTFATMNMKVNVMTALQRMKEFTEAGIPFSIEYYTLSGRRKVVLTAFLRPGYSKKQSSSWKHLIAYTDVSTNEHRQFHRSLLLKVNGIKIIR